MKKGDTVYWQDLKGEIVNDDCSGDYKLYVVFEDLRGMYFTKDGRFHTNTPQTLSLTPYTLKGFSQEQSIQIDTLVYVKIKEKDSWNIRYYSHFENGKYYCFVNQLKSTETDETFDWDYCQVKNPLI